MKLFANEKAKLRSKTKRRGQNWNMLKHRMVMLIVKLKYMKLIHLN